MADLWPDSQLDPLAEFDDHGDDHGPGALTLLDEPADSQQGEDLAAPAPKKPKTTSSADRDSIKWLQTPSGQEIPFVLKHGTNTVYCGTVVMEKMKASNGKTTVLCFVFSIALEFSCFFKDQQWASICTGRDQQWAFSNKQPTVDALCCT